MGNVGDVKYEYHRKKVEKVEKKLKMGGGEGVPTIQFRTQL